MWGSVFAKNVLWDFSRSIFEKKKCLLYHLQLIIRKSGIFFKCFYSNIYYRKVKKINSLTTSKSKLSWSKYVYTCLQYIDSMSNHEQFQEAWVVWSRCSAVSDFTNAHLLTQIFGSPRPLVNKSGYQLAAQNNC